MKKILSLLSISAMVLSIAACNGQKTDDTTPAGASVTGAASNNAVSTPSATKKVEQEAIKAYKATDFASANAKSSVFTEADDGIVVPSNGWLFFANVDFGTRGAKGLTTHVHIPEAADGGQILMYIDGTADGDVSNAILCTTVELNKSGIDTWCKRLANIDPSITDVHNVTFVFKVNADVKAKDFEFQKAAHTSTRTMDYIEPTTPCTLDEAKESKGGWNGRIYADTSMNNTVLSLGGDSVSTGYNFEHGMSMNAIGYLVYDIPEGSKKFVAIVGIDDSVYNNTAQHRNASVTYTFSVDGNAVYTTEVMRPGMYEMIDIPLTDGDAELRIDIGDAGNGITCDNADICEPGFVE